MNVLFKIELISELTNVLRDSQEEDGEREDVETEEKRRQRRRR